MIKVIKKRQNLNTNICFCGHEMTMKDRTGEMTEVPHGFYGGNVDKFAEAVCPECGRAYLLYLKWKGGKWNVKDMRPIAIEKAEAKKPKTAKKTQRKAKKSL